MRYYFLTWTTNSSWQSVKNCNRQASTRRSSEGERGWRQNSIWLLSRTHFNNEKIEKRQKLSRVGRRSINWDNFLSKPSREWASNLRKKLKELQFWESNWKHRCNVFRRNIKRRWKTSCKPQNRKYQWQTSKCRRNQRPKKTKYKIFSIAWRKNWQAHSDSSENRQKIEYRGRSDWSSTSTTSYSSSKRWLNGRESEEWAHSASFKRW